MQWRHQQELAEVKHNADLLMMELRQSMEAEKQKVLTDFKKQADIEKHKAVAETKKKQWCAHCGKEAIFYCCWNTSYCDYPCQVCSPLLILTCVQYVMFFSLFSASSLANSYVNLCSKPVQPRWRRSCQWSRRRFRCCSTFLGHIASQRTFEA